MSGGLPARRHCGGLDYAAHGRLRAAAAPEGQRRPDSGDRPHRVWQHGKGAIGRTRPQRVLVPGEARGAARFQDPAGARDPAQQEPAEDRRVTARFERSRRARRPSGRLAGDAGDFLAYQAVGAHVGVRVDMRGERNREGTGGAGDPQMQPSQRWPFRGD